jgi:hypothetical protein
VIGVVDYRVQSMRRRRQGIPCGPRWWYVQRYEAYGVLQMGWRRCTQNFMTVDGAQRERDRLRRAMP